MNVCVLKLFSGEEIIAREVESLSGYSYAKPMVIQMMQTNKGMGAGLVPYIMSAPEATIVINPDAIVTKLKADKHIEDVYLQQTSGIDLSGVSGL